MNYSELLQLAKGWGNFIFDRVIIWRLQYKDEQGHIYIENDIAPRKDLKEAVDRVNEAKKLIESGQYLARVKGEGGTGIPKICKIVNYDLKYSFTMDFGYNATKCIFFMKIDFAR